MNLLINGEGDGIQKIPKYDKSDIKLYSSKAASCFPRTLDYPTFVLRSILGPLDY